MKNIIYAICVLALMVTGFTAPAQMYKSAEDTVNLNKEFIEVSNDIANLTAKLTIAKNNLPGYKDKANTAEARAEDAAVNSSVQADIATGGSSVKEAKKAKRASKKAYREAKDARSANNNIGDQDDKIASLTGELAKKQTRLEQLTAMRDAINAQLTQ